MNRPPFPPDLAERLREAGFIAVLVLEDATAAVPLARALVDGGVRAIELTLRTPAALHAFRRIRSEVPEMIAGVGTILTPQQVAEVHAAGAAFGVAPGGNPRVIATAQELGLPFAPGVCTPTDLELAVERGCRWLKFFPAEPSGGVEYLRSVTAPLAHLDIRWIPLGGIDAGNMTAYLKEPSVAAVGGSWVTPKRLIDAEDWDAIGELAEQASRIVAEARRDTST